MSRTGLAGEKFNRQEAFEWLKGASRNCHDVIKLYEDWEKVNSVRNGEITKEEYCIEYQRMRDYDKVRYPDVKEVSKEEACFCLKFVEEALSFLQYIEKCSGGGIIG